MANDLVQWGPRGVKRQSQADNEEEEWDAPPSALAKVGNSRSAARKADKDAVKAHQVGDNTLAFQREGDAAEHRQTRWDWGDARTWIWIVGMCAGFLLVCAFVYFMPQGRHNQADLPSPVPTVRVY
jgi:hypothetical protein